MTGDHALTGRAIGAMLGITAPTDPVITGPEIDAMSDEQLRGVVNSCNIFARASPENKLRIVRALQTGPGYQGAMDGDDEDDDGPPPAHAHTPNGKANASSVQNGKGKDAAAAAAAEQLALEIRDDDDEEEEDTVVSRHIVAMTGDGVNDAPALKVRSGLRALSFGLSEGERAGDWGACATPPVLLTASTQPQPQPRPPPTPPPPRLPTLVWPWASPAPTSPRRPPRWCWRTTTLPRSCPPSRRGGGCGTTCARCAAWGGLELSIVDFF